eukprot:gene7386-5200_t
MALVEPYIGYLLSKYKETAKEGLQKIRTEAANDKAFAPAFLNNHQAIEALKQALLQRELETAVVETLCALAEACSGSADGNSAARSTLVREFIHDEPLAAFKKALSNTSDAGFGMACAVLNFFSLAAKFVPKVLLARFHGRVPLHLPCFRQQLPYTQRRLRLYRAQFLINLATSRFMDPTEVLLAHGFLTSLLEDGADLLLEGSVQGQALGREALRLLDESFIRNRSLTAEQKRSRLLSQRNIIRLLVKALDYAPVADEVIQLLFAMVTELLESPSDYSRNRIDGGEDHGMPNYILFLLLRQLRPKKNPKIVDIITRILTAAPDLIRPYFARFSNHLMEEYSGGGGSGIAPATGRVAIIHLMTRLFMAPLPYHLANHVVTLNFTTAATRSAASPDTFYHMGPKDVADEICPQWFAEFAHKIINGSTDLLFLVLTLQMTQAAMYRAEAVLEAIRQVRRRRADGDNEGAEAGGGSSFDAVFQEGSPEECWETFEAEMERAVLSALPKREEFWHRLTQQLHPELLNANATAALEAPGSVSSSSMSRVEFVLQRMLLLMRSYATVFRLRISWISAIPHQLPALSAAQQQELQISTKGGAGHIAALLRSDVDVLLRWAPQSISALCSLLCCSLANGVAMSKLHHITMTNQKGGGGLTEWPLLLRLLAWVHRHRHAAFGRAAAAAADGGVMKGDEETVKAIAWVGRVTQWAVHGVTVSLGCEWSEVLLWLELMELEAIPCLLHTLNHLLQRSLSKAADRVALEFLHAEHGVLVMAATNFIEKAKEKKQEESSGAKKGAAAQSASSAVWVDDLQMHLPIFEKVVAKVQRRWKDREALAAAFQRLATGEGEHLPFLLSSTPTQDAHPLASRTAAPALLSALDQLVRFRQTARAPAPPATEAESSFLARLQAKKKKAAPEQRLHLLHLGRAQEALRDAAEDDNGMPWFGMNTLCWELAGEVLRSVAEVSPGTQLRSDSEAAVFGEQLLRIVAAAHKKVRDAHRDVREDNVVGFYFLVLCCLHVMLMAKSNGQSTPLTDADAAALAKVLRQAYRGTVSVPDRMRYASLLTLHYLQQDGIGAATGKGAEDSGKYDEQKDEEAEAEEEQVVEAKEESRPRSGAGASRCFFRDAAAPVPLVDARYAVWGHRCASYLTPEVDVLTFMTDVWTDQELMHMAMEMPSRLHNTLLCGSTLVPQGGAGASSSPQRAPLHDVTRAIFPEVAVEEDFSTCLAEAATSNAILDPRYFLPLMQTVFALPRDCITRRFMGIRCFPYLLRSLSLTDPSLRLHAISALSTVYIPPGPVKVVHSFARLKMIQLSQKRGGSDTVPRLPAPVSAFLVLSVKALGRYDDPLHHHLVRFLIDTSEAFAEAVPFHQWLTAFPLGAISHPLMISQQEKALKRGGGGPDGSAVTAADSSTVQAIEQFKKATPPQLRFILDLIQHGCQTQGDAIALVESQSLQGVMLLCSLLTVSSDLRLELIQCLTRICFAQSSTAVAVMVAQEGRVFLWLFHFLMQLCREYGPVPSLYAEPLFRATMSLVTRLCTLLQRHGDPSTRGLLEHQVGDHILLLRFKLTEAGVTAKETLDAVGQMERVWRSPAPRRPAAGQKHQRSNSIGAPAAGIPQRQKRKIAIRSPPSLPIKSQPETIYIESSKKPLRGDAAPWILKRKVSGIGYQLSFFFCLRFSWLFIYLYLIIIFSPEDRKLHSLHGGIHVTVCCESLSPGVAALVHFYLLECAPLVVPPLLQFLFCQCEVTAQYCLGREGKPPYYTCAQRRCKFIAASPTQCAGYHRVELPTASPSPNTVIIRFEALQDPMDELKPAVMAVCEGNLYEGHEVRRLMEDEQFAGVWYPARKAYLYSLPHYAPLLAQLNQLVCRSRSSSGSAGSASLVLLVEPIPTFFFQCVDQGNQLVRASAKEVPDGNDIVYQQLRPFQQRGVEFILQHGGRGMIADEMGLGKTVQAIAAAHYYREAWPLLVVCPMSLMENWGKEICRFCSIPFARIGFVQGKKATVSDVHDVVIASYSSLDNLPATYRIAIFDESHYIKAADSKRTKTALEIAKKAERVILLSGTPTLSRPMELYTQLSAIAPRSSTFALLPAHIQYAARYCNAHLCPRAGVYTVNTDGHSHTDELHLLLRYFMIRRSKKELGNDLPSKSRQLLYVTVPEKGKASLSKQVSALRKTVDASGGGNDAADVVISRAQNAFELKIATAQAKIPAVTDYVMGAVEKHMRCKEKLIVFAHHQCMMEAIKAAVEKVSMKHPVDYILISGETPSSQREKLADHFRKDPLCVVAILSMQSSGVGHNFTCASTVIFTELDWNPSTHLQCEDRVHRIGQSKPCVIRYLLAEGTADSVIWPMLNSKLSVTTAVLSGAGEQRRPSAGVPFEKADREGATLQGEGCTAHRVILRGGEALDSQQCLTSTQRTLDNYLAPSQPQGQHSSDSNSNGNGGKLEEGRTPQGSASPASGTPVGGTPRRDDPEELAAVVSFEEMRQNQVWRETAHTRAIPGVPRILKPPAVAQPVHPAGGAPPFPLRSPTPSRWPSTLMEPRRRTVITLCSKQQDTEASIPASSAGPPRRTTFKLHSPTPRGAHAAQETPETPPPAVPAAQVTAAPPASPPAVVISAPSADPDTAGQQQQHGVPIAAPPPPPPDTGSSLSGLHPQPQGVPAGTAAVLATLKRSRSSGSGLVPSGEDEGGQGPAQVQRRESEIVGGSDRPLRLSSSPSGGPGLLTEKIALRPSSPSKVRAPLAAAALGQRPPVRRTIMRLGNAGLGLESTEPARDSPSPGVPPPPPQHRKRTLVRIGAPPAGRDETESTSEPPLAMIGGEGGGSNEGDWMGNGSWGACPVQCTPVTPPPPVPASAPLPPFQAPSVARHRTVMRLGGGPAPPQPSATPTPTAGELPASSAPTTASSAGVGTLLGESLLQTGRGKGAEAISYFCNSYPLEKKERTKEKHREPKMFFLCVVFSKGGIGRWIQMMPMFFVSYFLQCVTARHSSSSIYYILLLLVVEKLYNGIYIYSIICCKSSPPSRFVSWGIGCPSVPPSPASLPPSNGAIMLSAERANDALLGSRQNLYRPICFEKYKKPQVTEYPRRAVVLNPQHTQQQHAIQQHQNDGVDPLLEKKLGKSRDIDDDDPSNMDPSTFLCSDQQLQQVMQLGWKEVGPVGQGLENMGNTCFANAVLQAIAYTPALAQYFATSFRSANSQIGAPHDFAYALGETVRQMHLNNIGGRGGGAIRPTLLMKHLRNLSPHFQLGRQCDAHEFAVQLLFAAQKAILFRHVGTTKLPHRATTTTALLRICGGFLLSQVSWSRRDEIDQLQKKGKRQEAADLEMEGKQGGPNRDRMVSNTYDPITILTVELAGHTLENCLQKFCEKERLDGRCYHTPRGVGVIAEKQFSIHIPPNVLMIQLKRFAGTGGKASKRIRYPLELNLQPFCSPRCRDEPHIYTLNAVCIHSGHSIHSGHYYSVVRARNGSWYECNDSLVKLISEDRALEQEAYMLFYSRKEPHFPNESRRVVPSSVEVPQHSATTTSAPLRPPAFVMERRKEEVGTSLSEEEVRAWALQRPLKRISSDLSPMDNDRTSSPKQRAKEDNGEVFQQQSEPMLPIANGFGKPPQSVMDSRVNRYAISQRSTPESGLSIPLRSVAPTNSLSPSSSQRSRLPPLEPSESPLQLQPPGVGCEDELPSAAPSGAGAVTQRPVAPQSPRQGGIGRRGLFRNSIVASSASYSNYEENRKRSSALNRRAPGNVPTVPTTLQRPKYSPKFQQQVTDPLWQRSMDEGRTKKVRVRQGTASDDVLTKNRFQEASERSSKESVFFVMEVPPPRPFVVAVNLVLLFSLFEGATLCTHCMKDEEAFAILCRLSVFGMGRIHPLFPFLFLLHCTPPAYISFNIFQLHDARQHLQSHKFLEICVLYMCLILVFIIITLMDRWRQTQATNVMFVCSASSLRVVNWEEVDVSPRFLRLLLNFFDKLL